MAITDEMEKQEKAKNQKLAKVTEAIQKEKSCITEIMTTKGYAMIKKYWEDKLKQATIKLKNVRISDMQEFGRVQAEANLAEQFIDYLNNKED